jgi:Na+-driven multidrug efflux pump
MCGLDVVPALSISTTIYNLTAVIFRSLGITVGIITGQMLGAGCSETEVRDSNRKQIALCVCSGIVFGAVTAAFSKGFPMIFNTTDPVRQLAGQLILISAFCMPLHAYIMPVYFTLRSGGKTWITFLFDCGAIWALMLPLAFCLTRFTALPIIPVYILCNAVDAIKCAVGVVMIRKGNWVQNLAIK